MKGLFPVVLLLAAFTSACTENPITTTPTAVEANVTETFIGTLQPGGYTSFNFSVVTVPGNLAVKLSDVAPSADVQLGLGIGTPSGATCVIIAGASMVTSPSTTPQVSGTATVAGTLCVAIYDPGGTVTPTLTDPVDFTVVVAHS